MHEENEWELHNSASWFLDVSSSPGRWLVEVSPWARRWRPMGLHGASLSVLSSRDNTVPSDGESQSKWRKEGESEQLTDARSLEQRIETSGVQAMKGPREGLPLLDWTTRSQWMQHEIVAGSQSRWLLLSSLNSCSWGQDASWTIGSENFVLISCFSDEDDDDMVENSAA